MGMPFQVVCVFDDEKEAEDFFVTCGYSSHSMEFSHHEAALYGLLASDLGNKEARLFIAAGEGDERVLMRI